MGIVGAILVPLIDNENRVLNIRARLVQFDDEPPTLRLLVASSASSAEIFNGGAFFPMRSKLVFIRSLRCKKNL